MRICPNCNKEIEDNARYCEYCGEKQERFKIITDPKENIIRLKGIEKTVKIIICVALSVVLVGVPLNMLANYFSSNGPEKKDVINIAKSFAENDGNAIYEKLYFEEVVLDTDSDGSPSKTEDFSNLTPEMISALCTTRFDDSTEISISDISKSSPDYNENTLVFNMHCTDINGDYFSVDFHYRKDESGRYLIDAKDLFVGYTIYLPQGTNVSYCGVAVVGSETEEKTVTETSFFETDYSKYYKYTVYHFVGDNELYIDATIPGLSESLHIGMNTDGGENCWSSIFNSIKYNDEEKFEEKVKVLPELATIYPTSIMDSMNKKDMTSESYHFPNTVPVDPLLNTADEFDYSTYSSMLSNLAYEKDYPVTISKITKTKLEELDSNDEGNLVMKLRVYYNKTDNWGSGECDELFVYKYINGNWFLSNE